MCLTWNFNSLAVVTQNISYSFALVIFVKTHYDYCHKAKEKKKNCPVYRKITKFPWVKRSENCFGHLFFQFENASTYIFSVTGCLSMTRFWLKGHTGHSRYVDFAYLDTTTYVEVIFHSQHFFSIFLCISTPSMSKTVNVKQRVSRGDFSCPRRIFYYNCYCLCQRKVGACHGRHIVCFGYVHVLAEVRTSSKQQ